MPSMSYCRFENTELDFRACVDDLEEAECFDDLKHNEYETLARKRLYDLALQYIESYKRLEEQDQYE